MHGELRLLLCAGLSSAEALAAATSRSAEVYGIKDRAGASSRTAIADLLLVDGDLESDLLRGTRVVASGRTATGSKENYQGRQRRRPR